EAAASETEAGEEELLANFLQGLLRPAGRYCRGCAVAAPPPASRPPATPPATPPPPPPPHCASCARHAASAGRVRQLLKPCDRLFASCLWNGVPFDCCSNFRPLTTSRGACFSLNSRQTDGSANEEMFVVSHRKPEASIHLKFTEPVQ
ncbi:uncharacterized protein GBIM_13469, partial [Gryllus bimaculatus]